MKPGQAFVLLFSCSLTFSTVNGQSNFLGFNRIIPGWTNYSTAFSMTHDSDSASGEFATVGSFYTPPVNVTPLEFAAILIWYESGNVAEPFENFSFRIMLWSGLEAFIREPGHGDLASYTFSRPTGGSTAIRDSTTLGGRPAYHVRFALPGPTLILAQCHTYVIGLCAIAASNRAGELFVPTAPFAGDSDAQSGNIVPFGWTYLLNSGGSTIYFGQLATELRVNPMGEAPRLRLSHDGSITNWSDAPCYRLEMAEEATAAAWLPVDDSPAASSTLSNATRFFRLVKESPSRFVHEAPR